MTGIRRHISGPEQLKAFAQAAVGRLSSAWRALPAAAALTVLMPAAAFGGLVLTANGRQEGAVAVGPGVIRVASASVNWADAILVVNDLQAELAPAPEALHLKNGEVWAGKVVKLAEGRVTLESFFGRREVPVADVCAIDFMPGLPLIEDDTGGLLHRVKGRPVTGSLISIDADRAVIDTALGAVTLDKKDLKRYVLSGAKKKPEAPSDDEITLGDGSILWGKSEPTKDGLRIKHAVLGEQVIGGGAWRSVRRHSASVTYLAEAAPSSVKTFPVIRRPADPPRVERARCGHPTGISPGFVSRVYFWPKTIADYKLPGQAGEKVLFRAAVALADGSRGAARVLFRLGDRIVFDQVLTPENSKPVLVSFEAEAAGELKLEVDFGKGVRFPCSVTMEDPYVITKQK